MYPREALGNRGMLDGFEGRNRGIPDGFEGRSRGMLDGFEGRGRGMLDSNETRSRGMPDGFEGRNRGVLDGFEGRGRGMLDSNETRSRGMPDGFEGRSRGMPDGFEGRSRGMPDGFEGRNRGMPDGFEGRGRGMLDNEGRNRGMLDGVEGSGSGMLDGIEGRSRGILGGIDGRSRGTLDGLEGRSRGLDGFEGRSRGIVDGNEGRGRVLLDGNDGRNRGMVDAFEGRNTGVLDGLDGRKRGSMESNSYFTRTYDFEPKRQRAMETNPYTTDRSHDVPNRLGMVESGSPYYMARGASDPYHSGGHNSGSGKILSYPAVRLRGLPFACEEQDVRDFLTGLEIVDCLMVKKDGRFSGEVYVIFSTPMQAERAIQRDRQTLRNRYIEVFECSKEEYYVAVAAEVNFWEVSGKGTRQNVPSSYSKRTREDKDRDEYAEFLKLRGLPYSVTKSEILDFFRDFHLREDKNVRIVRHDDGKATGEAYVAFASPGAAKKAMCMDKKMIGSRYVDLFPLTHDQAPMAEL